jgi:hypothetical protein
VLLRRRCPLYGVVVIVRASWFCQNTPYQVTALGTGRLSPQGIAPDGSWKLVTRAKVAITLETAPSRRTIAMRPPGQTAGLRANERTR